MRSIWTICFIVILGTVASFGQGAPEPPKPSSAKAIETPEWGVVKDGKFVSEALGLTMSIPADVVVVSTAEAKLLRDAGKDMLKQGATSEKKIDDAANRSINLLVITEKPRGSKENSALELVAVKQQKGVTANMSLLANIAILKGSPYSLKRSHGPLKVGSNTFAAADLEGTFGEVKLTQRMYTIMNRGYSVTFALVYSNDDQRLKLEQILSTLTVK
jgi:hypothetical protein